MNIKHITEHLAGLHMSQCDTYQGGQCDCGALIHHHQGSEMQSKNLFVTVPEVTLPGGLVVPSFQVGQYLCGKSQDDLAIVTEEATPWVRINHAEAIEACAAIGGTLITETQYLAIAHDICGQAINWDSGKIGVGSVYQGLHLGTVDGPQPGDYVSLNVRERRWHQLSNGQRVWDFSGNVYCRVFDDVQGDEQGLVAREFAADSPSIATAPFPSMENGMGWRPDAGDDWSGYALVRGGFWDDGDNAGVFYLDDGWADRRRDGVGFRCTN